MTMTMLFPDMGRAGGGFIRFVENRDLFKWAAAIIIGLVILIIIS